MHPHIDLTLVFNGTTTSQSDFFEALMPVVLPYLQSFPIDPFRYNNGEPHMARNVRGFVHQIASLSWTACSPNLSPMQHVWIKIKGTADSE
ncbi:hypothetical protein TNCV_3997321 [Trichonephila clavipes]|nr:hypothetical protein TNCV_3997321 [Trichonephila clavipes]